MNFSKEYLLNLTNNGYVTIDECFNLIKEVKDNKLPLINEETIRHTIGLWRVTKRLEDYPKYDEFYHWMKNFNNLITSVVHQIGKSFPLSKDDIDEKWIREYFDNKWLQQIEDVLINSIREYHKDINKRIVENIG